MRALPVLLLAVAACSSKPTSTQIEPTPKAIAPAPPTPVAIAFVIEGHEMWIGNDKLDLPDHERYPGALEPLRAELAKLDLTAAPVGSTATLITYGDKPTIRHPMSPLATLNAAALGEQKDYAGIIGRDLVGGVTLGLAELAKTKGARRVLVVIGDGTDSNADKAKEALTALAERAARENVKLVSFIYKGILSPSSNPLAAFDPEVMTVSSLDAIEGPLETLFDDVTPKPAVAGGKGIALALLVSGQEIWMGNDDLVAAADPARYPGALKAIRAAFANKPMAGFPPGSEGMILQYDSQVRTVRKLGPIERLDADAMGDQKAYFGTTGTELVQGVRGALSQLARVDATRRVLVILGDGNDTNNDAAKAQLRALQQAAAQQKVEVHAIIYKSTLSADTDVIRELDPKATLAKTSDEITSQLSTLLGSFR